jgi:hypothetical protein
MQDVGSTTARAMPQVAWPRQARMAYESLAAGRRPPIEPRRAVVTIGGFPVFPPAGGNKAFGVEPRDTAHPSCVTSSRKCSGYGEKTAGSCGVGSGLTRLGDVEVVAKSEMFLALPGC